MTNMKLYPRKSTRPLKAIRLFCFECMGMSRTVQKPKAPIEDVKGCTDYLCPLLDFRFAKNPYLRGRTKGDPKAFENISRKPIKRREK